MRHWIVLIPNHRGLIAGLFEVRKKEWWSVFGGGDNRKEKPCHSGIRRAAKNVTVTKLSPGTPELCSGGTKCHARPAVPRESNRAATRQTIPETSPIQDHQKKTGHPRSSLPLHSPPILWAEHRKGRDREDAQIWLGPGGVDIGGYIFSTDQRKGERFLSIQKSGYSNRGGVKGDKRDKRDKRDTLKGGVTLCHASNSTARIIPRA